MCRRKQIEKLRTVYEHDEQLDDLVDTRWAHEAPMVVLELFFLFAILATIYSSYIAW